MDKFKIPPLSCVRCKKRLDIKDDDDTCKFNSIEERLLNEKENI